MKLYIANCYDRHIDPVIKVFDTAEAAIAYCKEFMKEACAHKEYINYDESPINGEYLFYIYYQLESDHSYVTETRLNNEEC